MGEGEARVQPVILAGGDGTRLWPLSRRHYPKPFLPLGGQATLLQQTLARLEGGGFSPPLVICAEETRFLAAEQLRQSGVDGWRLLLEPEGRNTAPAIALAALSLEDDPVLLVMPADHRIEDRTAFLAAVKRGQGLAEAGKMVTFGIQPEGPETGYGYIKSGAALGEGLEVVRFVEKPDLARAKAYLDEGGYFWNSGIFMFRASAYLAELKRFRPDIFASCEAAAKGATIDFDFTRIDEAAFLQSPAESVDYAVMEQTGRAVMVPMQAGWCDIGSWQALWQVSDKSEAGNCEVGDVVSLDGRGNYIHADSRLVATVGLENMLVIESKDAVLVAPLERAQEVKALVTQLKAQNRLELHHHREEFRPWGKYDCVDCGDGYLVKRITVNPASRLSLQKHKHRAEHWVVVAGRARVTRGDQVFELSANQSTYIPLGEVHALENIGPEPLELIEVQSGEILSEQDIIRFEDDYGRG